MNYVLALQADITDVDEAAIKGPSSMSVFACYSTGSVVLC